MAISKIAMLVFRGVHLVIQVEARKKKLAILFNRGGLTFWGGQDVYTSAIH